MISEPTHEELLGYVAGDKFIVHKNPEHFFRCHDVFGVKLRVVEKSE